MGQVPPANASAVPFLAVLCLVTLPDSTATVHRTHHSPIVFISRQPGEGSLNEGAEQQGGTAIELPLGCSHDVSFQ